MSVNFQVDPDLSCPVQNVSEVNRSAWNLQRRSDQAITIGSTKAISFDRLESIKNINLRLPLCLNFPAINVYNLSFLSKIDSKKMALQIAL